jgi:2,4-dienoyl-CoA reductase-like NADH-dependent reductase (Old Yellow Enzyme family)/thioredoxin reductase
MEGNMNLIKSLMGRRQFLIAAGAASTSALALKKMAGVVDPAFQTNAAIAADKPATGGAVGLAAKYPHLLSPLRVRNKVLKNRIMHTPSPPHSLQGPENYPADAYRAHYSEMAKNAAIVTINEHFGKWPKTWDPKEEDGRSHYSDSMWEDIPPVHNYLDQMIEEIHCEGALVAGGRVAGGGMGAFDGSGKRSYTIEEVITQAKKIEDKGYDAAWVGDRYIKSREELRPVIEYMQAVRNATNLIIVAWVLPLSPGLSRGLMAAGVGADSGDLASGPEFEEFMAMVKMLEGSADIIQMKDTGHFTDHPNSFTMEKGKPFMLRFTKAIKESGVKIITAPGGGFHDPAMNEEFIASGKTDMVGMATPLFADPEYLKKVYEGRGEDVVPCVMCHNCHGVSRTKGPWIDVCTVNPKWGLSETKKRSIRPASKPKKVAVIGGGPAGMKAAITAAERGHKVTLYEKSDTLGGLLRHTDYTQWKWAYKDYKDYLINQMKKLGVDVHLSTEVTPEVIKAKGYDTVLAAVGAEPVISRLPGADGKNVFNILSAYSNKKALGQNVAIIGGGVFGTETGICLAKDGHKVTVLTSEKWMIPEEAIGPHNMENQLDIYKHHKNFSYVLEATATRISEGKVFYKDSSGSEKSIQTDSVVIYAGLKPKMDEAMKFSGSAGQVLLLGDCTGKAGTLQKTIRSAFFVASQV